MLDVRHLTLKTRVLYVYRQRPPVMDVAAVVFVDHLSHFPDGVVKGLKKWNLMELEVVRKS